MKFGFIHAEKALHSIRAMCRVLRVSTSGYYAWMRREPSQRSKRDAVLVTHIRAVHKSSNGTYGSPRVRAQLHRDGFETSRKRVARLMREHGIAAVPRRRFRRTTDLNHDLPIAPNVLKRDFTAAAPNRVWVTDITYVPTRQGWLYLAAILDLFSRRVVGWAVADHMRTELVLRALSRAVGIRQPRVGLIHHSDRGSQYASDEYRAQLKARGIQCSMTVFGASFVSP